MNELISINSKSVEGLTNTVNGRGLHEWLGVGKVFGAWMPEMIKSFGFIENQDFVSYEGLINSENGKNQKGSGRKPKEYALTIDMAKQLAMVQRTDKGREARLYFIECERKLKEQQSISQIPEIAANLNQVSAIMAQQMQMLAQMNATTMSQQIELQNQKQELDTKASKEDLEHLAKNNIRDQCPQGCESITRLRKRYNERHGLPARIVDWLIYNHPQNPAPYCEVRNANENAKGSTFSVWRVGQVSPHIKKFVSECKMETKTQASHPMIEGRFKLNKITHKKSRSGKRQPDRQYERRFMNNRDIIAQKFSLFL